MGEGNYLEEFLNKGEVSKVVQFVMLVLKVVNVKIICGNELSIFVKIVVSKV